MAKHVLIVDDEQSIAFFLGESLAELGRGYDVQIVGSGEEALGRLAVQTFDLLVTDLRLPGISGLELIRRVRQLSPQMRVILITGHGNGQTQSEARRLRVYGYIAKPFQMEQFIRMAQEALCLPAVEGAGQATI